MLFYYCVETNWHTAADLLIESEIINENKKF